MGRLTVRKIDRYGNKYIATGGGAYFEEESVYKALEKLAHYEDLEEQGRLVELPCAVGDTVWCISEKKIHKAIARKVTGVTGSNNYRLVKIEAEFEIEDPFYCDGRMMKMGSYGNYLENIFLTKEEAEAEVKLNS